MSLLLRSTCAVKRSSLLFMIFLLHFECGFSTGASAQTIPTAFVLLAAANTCHTISSSSTQLVEIWNSGPQVAAFLEVFSTSACSGTPIFGDGATVVLGPGQVVTLDVPLGALCYEVFSSVATIPPMYIAYAPLGSEAARARRRHGAAVHQSPKPKL